VTGTSCLFTTSGIGATLSSFVYDPNIVVRNYYGLSAVGDEAWLANQVATNGPVSACLYVSSKFLNYKSGGLI
jgi:hypothetical protein